MSLALLSSWAAPGGTATARQGLKTPDLERPIAKVDATGATVLPLHAPMPAASTGIGPGSHLLMTFVGESGTYACTANFVWTANETVRQTKPNGKPGKKTTTVKHHYLGAAGHCFLPPDTTSTHGADADWDAADTAVTVCVAECNFGGQAGFIVTGTHVPLGRVAYARQTLMGVDLANDFGIVEIPAELADQIRPSMPVWEGPSTLEDVSEGVPLCLYGNAAGFGEVFPTKARAGVGRGLSSNGRYWVADLPSFQGDSGSAIVTCGPDDDGVHGIGAAGILTHIAPGQAAIVGTTPSRAVEMTKIDTGIDMKLMLADGSEVAPTPPPAAPVEPDTVTALPMDGTHSWEAGPFTRTAPIEAILGEACSGYEPKSEYCDYEFVDIDVPEGGAELTVTIETDDAENDDFDVFVFGPTGEEVGSAAAAGTPPEVVTAPIVYPGTYAIGVDPYGVTDATYRGTVEVHAATPPEPEPEPPSDGEISLGETYNWTGDPPADVNPAFTCADPVNALCDDEFVKVNVPAGGATLVLDVTADTEGDDFDVCVYGGTIAQECVSEAGDEHAEFAVTKSGVYRIGVKAYAALGTYSASLSLQ